MIWTPKHERIIKAQSGLTQGEIDQSMIVPEKEVATALDAYFDDFPAILVFIPCLVPRSFLTAAGRFGLSKDGLRGYGGKKRGLVGERWFASVVDAANDGRVWHEGQSFITLPDGRLILFKIAISERGDLVVGTELMSEYGTWPICAKWFDFFGPIPPHVHQMVSALQKMSGLKFKPEGYHFPIEDLHKTEGVWPYTSFGWKPGTTAADIEHCFDRSKWGQGNDIYRFMRDPAYLRSGEGAFTPAGTVHDPGSKRTYEPQWGSDVFGINADISYLGEEVPWNLLVKDIPPDHHDDPKWIAENQFDWPLSTDPDLMEKVWCKPETVEQVSGGRDQIIIYGLTKTKEDGSKPAKGFLPFSSRRLELQRGAEIELKNEGCCSFIVTTGSCEMRQNGKSKELKFSAPQEFDFDKYTQDEGFICHTADKDGVIITATSDEFRLLRSNGPEKDKKARALAEKRWLPFNKGSEDLVGSSAH